MALRFIVSAKRYMLYANKWWRYGDSSPLSLSLFLRSPAALAVIRYAYFSCTAGVRVGFESSLLVGNVLFFTTYDIRNTIYDFMAGGGGFEPPLRDPEPRGLPLADPPIIRCSLLVARI